MDLTTALRRLRLACADRDESVAVALGRLAAAVDDTARPSFIRHAYWHMTEVPTDAFSPLLQLVAGSAQLRDIVGRGPLVGSCLRCGRGVRAAHRDAVDTGDPPQCLSCAPVGFRVTRPVGAPQLPWEADPAAAQFAAHGLHQIVGGRRIWAEDYGRCHAA